MSKRFFILAAHIVCLANFSHINAMVNPNRTYTYGQRIEYCRNPIAKNLLNIMEDKKSNLAFSVDVTNKEKLLNLADQIGPHICILKTHCDIIDGFDKKFWEQLRILAKKHNFLIFEDRKFADIGSTTVKQYIGGPLQIAQWADIVNLQTTGGDGGIKALASDEVKKVKKDAVACLLIAQMSSANALTKGDYTTATIDFAKLYPETVIGFICLEKLLDDPGILHFTTGVSLDTKGDALGQQYLTPEKVINESGSDIIIVGRSIYGTQNPKKEAERYQEAGWDAYQRSINKSKL